LFDAKWESGGSRHLQKGNEGNREQEEEDEDENEEEDEDDKAGFTRGFRSPNLSR
jgi:hypothetical protein